MKIGLLASLSIIGQLWMNTVNAQCVSGGTLPATTSADDASLGTLGWTSTSDAFVSDNNTAQASTLVAILSTVNTHYLKLQAPGFSIPSGATICGVEVSIERRAGGLAVGGGIQDASVLLVKNGVIGGSNHASGTGWTGSDVTATYGSNADLWGQTWTPADINAGNFGVAIRASLSAGLAALTLTAHIDYVSITVYYQNPVLMASKLEQFTVVAGNGGNVLAWTVATPEDNERYVIDRSADKSHWQTIGEVGAHSNVTQYQYNDPASLKGVTYYRLGILGTGAITYSTIRQITQAEGNLQLSPNPAKNRLRIAGQRTNASIILHDLQGRVVRSWKFDPKLTNVQLDIGGVMPGLYLIEVDQHTYKVRVADEANR